MKGLFLHPALRSAAGWTLLVAVAVAVVLALGHGLGLRWDPLGMTERRLRAAESQAATAISDAEARRLESEAMEDQVRRLDHLHQQAVAVERATAEAAGQARSAHDASTSLDPARADRLVHHDRELCRLAPAVCGAATSEPAGIGGATMRAGPPA